MLVAAYHGLLHYCYVFRWLNLNGNSLNYKLLHAMQLHDLL